MTTKILNMFERMIEAATVKLEKFKDKNRYDPKFWDAEREFDSAVQWAASAGVEVSNYKKRFDVVIAHYWTCQNQRPRLTEVKKRMRVI